MSTNFLTAQLISVVTEAGLRSLTFSRSRVSAELVLRYARENLVKAGLPAELIDAYRSGYTPAERRNIERSLFKGDLIGVSATNAMELGVDIGGLDVVLMNGYPGSISSFWQQVGRAGRGDRSGLAIMVARDDPLEHFLLRHPGNIFEVSVEGVSLNPENVQILGQQLLCAAHERALTPSELSAFGESALDVAESLDRSGQLAFSAGRFFYPSHEPPAPRVNIRGSDGDPVRLLVSGQELGTMERWRAMTNAHDGAIYLHRGSTFLVESLDLERNIAAMQPFDGDYYTQSIVQSILEQNFSLRVIENGEFACRLAGVRVTDVVNGYRLKALDGDRQIGTELLDLPPQTFDTLCVRFDFPGFFGKDPIREIGGLHGAEHAFMAIAALFAGCDRADLGSAWYTTSSDTLRPAIFIFDRVPGGVGLCERLFAARSQWQQAAADVLEDCNCGQGCPSCLYSSRCEVNNETLDKSGAKLLLTALFDALKDAP